MQINNIIFKIFYIVFGYLNCVFVVVIYRGVFRQQYGADHAVLFDADTRIGQGVAGS